MDKSIRGYERGVAQLQAGIDCRALWLSVIQQAVLDSQKREIAVKKDLPRTIDSQWWRQIFAFADVENMHEIVTQQIKRNLEGPRTHKKRIRHYTHGTTRPQTA